MIIRSIICSSKIYITDVEEDITQIIDYASIFEYRLSKGRRDIIHIETFLMNVINILKNKYKLKI